MRIAIASDHAARAHKDAIRDHLRATGHEVSDVGTHDDASCDYPDLAAAACALWSAGAVERVVLLCGSGIGVSITANKVPGLRCALAWNVETARLARQHNDAQALALGARFVDLGTARAMVDAWLQATFEPRHRRRLDKLDAFARRQVGREPAEERPAC